MHIYRNKTDIYIYIFTEIGQIYMYTQIHLINNLHIIQKSIIHNYTHIYLQNTHRYTYFRSFKSN